MRCVRVIFCIVDEIKAVHNTQAFRVIQGIVYLAHKANSVQEITHAGCVEGKVSSLFINSCSENKRNAIYNCCIGGTYGSSFVEGVIQFSGTSILKLSD